MHITRKNDQYFYFSDVPDVRSKRFWTDTTSSFGRWPKTLQLCPALVAFQIVHFRNVGHQVALPTILPKKVLGYVLFSAQPDLCQTFAVYHDFAKVANL